MRSYNSIDYGRKELRDLRKKSKQLRNMKKGKHESFVDSRADKEEGWDGRDKIDYSSWYAEY